MNRLLTLLLCWLLSSAGLAQAPFYEENFPSQSDYQNDWETGGSNNGPEDWVWDDNPEGFFEGQPAFGATTASNGHIIFNSDANGDNPHDVTVENVTPIDCSARSQVFLQFQSQYAYFSSPQVSIAQVGVSTDGQNFTYRTVLTEVPRNNLSSPVERTTIELPEAAGESTVYLQFRWQGQFEYIWRIDDVQLYEENPLPDVDLRLEFPLRPLSFSTPLGQVDSFLFGHAIRNAGRLVPGDIQSQLTIGSGGNTLLEFDQNLPGIQPTAADTFLFDQAFLPQQTGLYSFDYAISSGSTDANPGDNSFSGEFAISENTYAKDDGNIISATQPGTVQGDTWQAGNFYQVNADGFEANSIDFSLAIAEADTATLPGRSITVFLYELAANDDDVFDDDDVEIVGFGSAEVNSSENFQLLTADLLDINGGPGVVLEPNTVYIPMVEYPDDLFMPYSAIEYVDGFATIIRNQEWFNFGFGSDVTGVIRLIVNEIETSTEEVPELAAGQVTVFPNPARDRIQVQVDLQATSASLQLELLDIQGRELQRWHLEQQQNVQQTLDLKPYPNGNYLLRIVTEEGIRTERITVQR